MSSLPEMSFERLHGGAAGVRPLRTGLPRRSLEARPWTIVLVAQHGKETFRQRRLAGSQHTKDRHSGDLPFERFP
jgi:hypothetical protein